MKVSIVIPAHNEEGCIAQAIEASLAQDFKEPFEVIVVANGCTDRTAEIAEGFPGVRIIHEKIASLIRARQIGFEAAQGEIIAQLDADNVPPTYWLTRGAKYFNDPDVACASGPYDYYDAADLLKGGEFIRWLAYSFQVSVYQLIHYLMKLDHRGIAIGGNMFVRASTLRDIGGYNQALDFWGEDTDTALRLSELGDIIFTPRLTIKASARRMRKMGVKGMMRMYTKNFHLVHRGKVPVDH